MKKERAIKSTLALAAITLLAALLSPANAEAVSFKYEYNLSNFEGTVNTLWASIAADQGSGEVYILDTRDRSIGIFNRHGMEVYRFASESRLDTVYDVAVDESGNILLLGSRLGSVKLVVICDFKGNPVSEIKLENLPGGFSGLGPDRLIYRGGKLYLLNTGTMKLVVTDREGRFLNGYDIRTLVVPLADRNKKRKQSRDIDAEITGFGVDRDGNMLFTIAVMFTAFRLSPGGDLEAFGTPGSSSGKFGVASGITSDDNGNIFVSDRLRCVVMLFDDSLNFVTEFGFRGYGPGNLIVPDDVEVVGNRVYVSQAGNRGVSVYYMLLQ